MAGSEEPFSVSIEGGVLHGHRGGAGPPLLVLHGGPGLPDYMGACAALLQETFTTLRYTQRGTPPSSSVPPYTVDAHVADAVAVLDAFELERVWAVGHSWGGHLALHVLVAHPGRLHGVVCIDPLGAFGEVLGEYGENLQSRRPPEHAARMEELERRRREGRGTEEEALESLALTWPSWFADPARTAPFPFDHYGIECSIGTNASISEHFEHGTLERGLPHIDLPALFVHGEHDPLPLRTSTDTAALIAGARVVVVEGAGHLPWFERPDAFRETLSDFVYR